MGIYPDEVTTFAAVVLYGAPVAVAVLSYLLGCINGAIATSHIFYHDDVRRHGSGNAGFTNFFRSYGVAAHHRQLCLRQWSLKAFLLLYRLCLLSAAHRLPIADV